MSQFSFARATPKVLCLTVALVLGTGAAIVYASTTSSASGEISACKDKNGQLRVLAAGSACDTKKETPISWNIQGIQGPQGIQGEKGDTGAAASTSVTVRTDTSDGVNTHALGCAPGEVAVGGGYKMEGEPLTRTVLQSRPDTANNGWLVQQYPTGPLTVYVICIK